MTAPGQLTPEAAQLVRDIVAGLEDPAEKHRERARVRSNVLRMDDSYRQADNASQAKAGRERYAADPVESRRKSLERWHRPRHVCAANENSPLTTDVNGLHQVERKGVEPSTSALRTQRSPN